MHMIYHGIIKLQDHRTKKEMIVTNESRYRRFQRPEALFALFAPMVALPGVGDKLATVLRKKLEIM